MNKNSYLSAFRGHRGKFIFAQVICEFAVGTSRNNLNFLVLNSLVICSLVGLSVLPEDGSGTSFQNVASFIKTKAMDTA
jgi:hypothetical protein